MPTPLDISVVIPTRDRAESLRQTLQCLARADRTKLKAEAVVVDNGSRDETRNTSLSFGDSLSIRYLYEPEHGVYGKCHALNRALNAGGLGQIVVILDDDMSPQPDWFQEVASVCRRWPDKDWFGGRTPARWPDSPIPQWAMNPSLRGWIFSAAGFGDTEKSLPDGRWFLGGHFWFRSRVIAHGRRFRDIWLTEPDFMLQLAEEGYGNLYTPRVVAEHRVQPRLLEKSVARELAVKAGRCFAELRLQPKWRKVKQACLFRKHPILARVFCVANGLRWGCLYGISLMHPDSDTRFVRSLGALERMTTYFTFLRLADQYPEYRIWKKAAPGCNSGLSERGHLARLEGVKK